MKFTQSKYEGDDKVLTILPTACWHVGHLNCRYDVIQEWVNKLDYSHRGLILGDLAECATKTSIGRGLFDTDMTPDDQMDTIIDILKPKAEFIDACVRGNHEERFVNLLSIDILKRICRELHIEYLGCSGLVKYAWNDIAYLVNIWHGSGNGSTAATAIKCCEDMSLRTYADAYIVAHFHKNLHSDKLISIADTRNMKINKIQQRFIPIGSALDYDDGYADIAGMTARGLGWQELYLHGVKGKRKVGVQDDNNTVFFE